MAQILINIPDEEYEDFKKLKEYDFGTTFNGLVERIANGVVLPKGHGRLIDADELKNDAQTMTEWNGDVFRCVTERTIDYATTIIETDKEG